MDNVNAIKESYKEFKLPYYSRKEEIMNVITHGIGVPFTLVVLVLFLIKASSAIAVIAAIAMSFSGVLVFGVSALYHAQTVAAKKYFWRKIDHGDISFLCFGVGVPVALCVNATMFNYIIVAICVILCFVSLFLSYINLDKFIYVSFVLNFVIGVLIFIPFGLNFSLIPLATQVLMIVGVGLCLVGSVVYLFKIKYVHTIFHVITLIGPIMAFVAGYFVL